jgi:hypothetical protein
LFVKNGQDYKLLQRLLRRKKESLSMKNIEFCKKDKKSHNHFLLNKEWLEEHFL